MKMSILKQLALVSLVLLALSSCKSKTDTTTEETMEYPAEVPADTSTNVNDSTDLPATDTDMRPGGDTTTGISPPGKDNK